MWRYCDILRRRAAGIELEHCTVSTNEECGVKACSSLLNANRQEFARDRCTSASDADRHKHTKKERRGNIVGSLIVRDPVIDVKGSDKVESEDASFDEP